MQRVLDTLLRYKLLDSSRRFVVVSEANDSFQWRVGVAITPSMKTQAGNLLGSRCVWRSPVDATLDGALVRNPWESGGSGVLDGALDAGHGRVPTDICNEQCSPRET